MGISPLPTNAQKQNDKSGIALEKIQDAEAIGSFHFTDKFVLALENTGRQLDELITKLAQAKVLPRQLLGKDQKGEDKILKVAPLDYAPPESSEHLPEADQMFMAHRGQFAVTVADGPSYKSQREAQDAFADKMFETVENVAQILPPGSVSKILAIAVRMKNIGTFGDELADVLDPKDNSAAQLQQAQQQIQQAQQAAQEMQAEIQKLKLERAGHVIDNEYRVRIKEMEGAVKQFLGQLDADLKAYIANVQTKAQDASERRTLFQETQVENHHAAHEVALQKDQQAHEHSLADKQAVIAQAQAEQAANSEQESSPAGS
jgi:hypothetical protein